MKTEEEVYTFPKFCRDTLTLVIWGAIAFGLFVLATWAGDYLRELNGVK